MIKTSARTGVEFVYCKFGTEISCHLPGNVSNLSQLHQKQPLFAEVYSLRYI